MLAAVTTLLCLALLGATLWCANFTPGPWALAALLLLPLTVGLPTTLATLLVTWLWPGGPPLWLFAVACALAGAALQYSAFTLLARWRGRR